MRVIDREPIADNNIRVLTVLETSYSVLSETPTANTETSQATIKKEDITGKGSGRIINRMFSNMLSAVTNFAEKYLHRRKASRGECPACAGGAGDHHWGSRCKQRRTPGAKITLLPSLNLTRPIPISSGF